MTYPHIDSGKNYHLKFEHGLINCNFSLSFYDFISPYDSILSYQIILLMGKSTQSMNQT